MSISIVLLAAVLAAGALEPLPVEGLPSAQIHDLAELADGRIAPSKQTPQSFQIVE